MSPNDRWLRMGEACYRASLSRPTLRGLCESGVVTGEKLKTKRGDWRILESSLDRYITSMSDADAFAIAHLEALGL